MPADGCRFLAEVVPVITTYDNDQPQHVLSEDALLAIFTYVMRR